MGTTWYPAGYSKPVTTLALAYTTRQQPRDKESSSYHPSGHHMVQHYAGIDLFQLTHTEMFEHADQVEWLKEEL